MNDSKPKFVRRIIIINKEFQYKFSMLLLVPVAIIQFIFWIAIEFFFFKMIQFGKDHQLPIGHNYYRLLSIQKKEFMIILALSSILVAAVMFIWGIYLSHRIAGPLFKLEKYLNEAKSVEDIKSKPLFFRKKDFFLNIPKAFNQFTDRL
jgi:hypothetical protein